MKTENKVVAQFPTLKMENGKWNPNLLTDFESYVNDNIGFKEEAIISDLILKYKLFGRLAISTYIQGKDENLFYNSDGFHGVMTYQGRERYPQDKIEATVPLVENAYDYYQKKGATFFIMTIPDKEGIYPEYYPDGVYRESTESKLDLWTKYVATHSKAPVFSLKNALLSQKKNYDLLYYKNYDCTHWNMNGAFVGYSELMRQIQKKIPGIKAVEKKDVIVTKAKSPGTLVHLSGIPILGQVMNMDDTIYFYDFASGFNGANVTDKKSKELNWPQLTDMRYYTDPKSLNPQKILVIGDSYVYDFLMPLLSQSFRKAVFTHEVGKDDLQRMEKQVQPDIVILETVDRVTAIGTLDWLSIYH